MNIIFAYILVALITMYTFVISRYILGAALVFFIMVIEVVMNFPRDINGTIFTIVGMLVITILVVVDGRRKGEGAALIKYNPYYEKTLLPRRLQIILLIMIALALFSHVLYSTRSNGKITVTNLQRLNGSKYVNDIISVYRQGGDYHSVALTRQNKVDVFAVRVARTLVAELERLEKEVEKFKHISDKANDDSYSSRLSEFVRDCRLESSNMVVRLESADIGQRNAQLLIRILSIEYRSLEEKFETLLHGIDEGKQYSTRERNQGILIRHGKRTSDVTGTGSGDVR